MWHGAFVAMRVAPSGDVVAILETAGTCPGATSHK